MALDHTYDQVLRARCAKKMITNTSGTSDHEPVVKDETKYRKKAREEPDSEGLTSAESNGIREAKSVALYVKYLGQYTSRREWTDAYNLTDKGLLPSQGASGNPKTSREQPFHQPQFA